MHSADRARLRAPLGAVGMGDRALDAVEVTLTAHGTRVGHARRPDGTPQRRFVVDPLGTPTVVLDWREDGLLARGSVRIADGRWITIEPHASHDAPWGLSDRLWAGARPYAREHALTAFESVAYHAIDRLPALAEPARLPRGAGTAVLNLLAALAVDQQRETLTYEGPYPTEQLFLALLESFHYEAATGDPLAEFAAGRLRWRPAPFDVIVERDGVTVQLRAGVEKVAWRARAYWQLRWQDIERRGAHRVRDVDGSVRCSLWALGSALEDHLELAPDGRLRAVLPAAPRRAEAAGPLPPVVAAGIVAIVAAASAPALASPLHDLANELAVEWAPLDGMLATLAGRCARIATTLRDALTGRVAAAPSRAATLAVALAALGDVATALGDALRLQAQARLAAAPADRQAAALNSAATADPDDARRIVEATEALARAVA